MILIPQAGVVMDPSKERELITLSVKLLRINWILCIRVVEHLGEDCDQS